VRSVASLPGNSTPGQGGAWSVGDGPVHAARAAPARSVITRRARRMPTRAGRNGCDRRYFVGRPRSPG
jgi:hypothetical protein